MRLARSSYNVVLMDWLLGEKAPFMDERTLEAQALLANLELWPPPSRHPNAPFKTAETAGDHVTTVTQRNDATVQ